MNGAYVSNPNQGTYGSNSKFEEDGLPKPAVRQYKRDRRGWCSCRGICCILCALFAFFIIAVGVLVLVAYLELKPKSPHYNITSVSIQDLSVAQGNSSTGNGTADIFLTSNLAFNLLTQNPNRLEIKVKNSTVDLFFQTRQVGQANIPAFTQGKNSEKNVTITASIDNVDLLSESSNFLAAYNNGSVPLSTNSVIKGNVKIWGITSPPFQGTLKCTLSIDPQTRQLLSRSCSVSDVKLA